jgi:uncharacterized protein
MSRKSLPVLLALAAVLLLPACGGNDKAAPAVKSFDEFFDIKIGDRIVKVQVAVLPAEQQRGLMFRKTLGPDEGMLFAFARTQRMTFYMRNTSVPLDIGYLSPTGELKEIYPMYAFDETTVASRSTDLQYALEMNQGWFKDRGVKPGARLDLKTLAAALAARGLKLQVGELP